MSVEYYTALGRLNDAFTAAEIDLTACIKLLATRDVPEAHRDIVVALIGGMRMKAAKDVINRLLRVCGQGKATQEHVAKVFGQLGEIQWLRDRLAHNLTMRAGQSIATPKTFINSGIDNYLEWDKVVTFGFDIEAMEAATADLTIIPDHLGDIWNAVLENLQIPTLVLPPWQYKSSMLDR